LKRIKRSASEVGGGSASASAGVGVVTVTNNAMRRRRELKSVGGCCGGGDQDMFLVRYGLALFIWLFWGFECGFMEN